MLSFIFAAIIVGTLMAYGVAFAAEEGGKVHRWARRVAIVGSCFFVVLIIDSLAFGFFVLLFTFGFLPISSDDLSFRSFPEAQQPNPVAGLFFWAFGGCGFLCF